MLFTRREIVANALLLPTFAQAQAPDGSFRTIEARTATHRIAPEPLDATPVWTFEGSVPGPILRVKKGDELRLRLINKLTQSTAIHWQGVRIANAMDGVAGLTQPPIAPGASFDYRFTPPDSGTFFYRPSAWPYAAEQKGRGLYGMLIVDEAEPAAVDHEIVLVLDDWRLDDKAVITGDFLAAADVSGEGRIGSTLTVNTAAPAQTMKFEPGARVRLRLLNACSARMAGIIFENANPQVIAIDGQPCDAFSPIRNIVPVGPGARFDLVLNLPAKAGEEARILLRGGGLRADQTGETDQPLLILQADGEARPARPAFPGLGANPLLPPEIKLQNARRLDLTIEASESKDPRQAWTINGVSGSPQVKPLFSAPRGQPVSLGFFNRTKVAQTLHLHGHHMRVLHLLDDGWEPYWRDSVIIAPGRTVRVAFLADNPGKWMLESTILEHAMSGVSAWFEVK